MSENRAYKLNAQRQPGSKQGTFLYYYYDADGHLTCDELNSKLFDKLVEMDDKYYNLERGQNITTRRIQNCRRTTMYSALRNPKTCQIRRCPPILAHTKNKPTCRE